MAMPTLSANMHVPTQHGAAINFEELVAGGSEEQLEWALGVLGPAGVSSQVRARVCGSLERRESPSAVCLWYFTVQTVWPSCVSDAMLPSLPVRSVACAPVRSGISPAALSRTNTSCKPHVFPPSLLVRTHRPAAWLFSGPRW